MNYGPTTISFPELIIGVAGPIGIDIDAINRSLQDVLTSVGYRSALIRITDEIDNIPSSAVRPQNNTFYNLMKFKMEHASTLCREKDDPAYLMRLAMRRVPEHRQSFFDTKDQAAGTLDDAEPSPLGNVTPSDNWSFPFFLGDRPYGYRSAYIIRQLKRPQEVRLLRHIYGKQFILISAYGSKKDREELLARKIRDSDGYSPKESDTRERYLAGQLVDLDANEENDVHGQHMRDTFHMADVVVDGIDKSKIHDDLERFIKALFGLNEAAPSRHEHGMNAAFAASLRSSDLSRQVGAVIFAETGEIVAQGCNEVPKAFGGTYWDGETPDYRDVKLGRDSNDILKMDVLKDLFGLLKKNGLLSDEIAKRGSPSQIAKFLVGQVKAEIESDDAIKGSLSSAKILDLTEYGRVVHAEMSAICDAARNGHKTRNSVLYTTTFPCHNCTKHVLAAGIRQVIYLEPYPKSKAQELHDNEIIIEGHDDKRVSFNPFLGITPFRYQDIFKKGKRKRDGVAARWQHGYPAPMVDVSDPSYIAMETHAAWYPDQPPAEDVQDSDSATIEA